MKTLQILIAHYNEDIGFVKRLLDSIALQQGVDMNNISALICNDGYENKIPLYLLNNYPFKIKYIEKEHSGICATRNKLLDESEADYIIFCDCDDLFCNAFFFYLFNNTIKNIDVYSPNYYQELVNADTLEHKYVLRIRDPFLIHSKIYSRNYLIKNDIRWDDSITNYGDHYFTWQSILLTKNIIYPSLPCYIWTYNKKSVSRETNYFNKNLHFCIRAYSKLIDNFDKRGKTDFRDFFIAYTIIYTYFRMMKKDWINIDNSNEHIIIEEFRTFFKTYQHYYQNIKPEVFSKAYEKIKTMYNGKEPNGGKQNFIIWLVNIMK